MATAATEASFTERATKDPFWAPASVIGLAGFGTTTMLAGMAIASNGPNWGVDNGVVFPMALAFGGTAQAIAGVIMLRRGEIFPGSAFVGYGAFWWAFTIMLSGILGPNFAAAAAPYDVMWFMIIWFLWTFSFLINANKHGVGIFLVFLFLAIAYILLSVDFGTLGAGHTVSMGLWEATGIVTFIDGLIAWYVATGILTANHHDGKKVLPY
ncbi:MAG: acetate uptake transporter [Thermoplasmata archaeon]